jgi:hypothetical protein
VRIRSSPPGAQVIRIADGALVGVTPCEVESPRGADVDARLRVTLAGYRDEEIRLLPDGDRDRSITLTSVRREPETRRPTPPPAPAPRKRGDPVDPFAQ